MKPSTPKTELSPSTQLRKKVFGSFLETMCFVFALGLTFFTATASADVAGYFKFDNFPGNNAAFTDDSGKGLNGLLGFPFSQPRSVAGPSGQASDRAVALDLNGGLAVDDSGALLNFLTPPLTLECWVRSTNDTQVGRHRAFISYGIPGGPPVAGLVRGGYNLGLAPSGELRFTLFAVVDVFSGIPFPFDGAWHHVAATYSIPDGGVTFYLDGQNVAFVAETRDITPPGSRHLDIGAFFTGLGRFDGDIDRVRISKAGLTAAQLDSVAGTVKPVAADTAVFFNLDEASPPYQGQGLFAGIAIPTAQWVTNHPPRVSAGGPNASAAGPAKVTDTPSEAANDLAIQFDVAGLGEADVAAVSDPNGVLNLNGDWTLEAWVKPTNNVTGDRDVIFYYGHPGHGYSLSVNYLEGNKLQVTTLGIADMPATNDTAVVEFDVWQHVAVVHKNGQSITYFINGKEVGTRSYTGGTILATTNKVLYIGAEWNGGLPFTGFIDRVRISNSALTASELDSDPKNPKGAAVPGAAFQLVENFQQTTLGDLNGQRGWFASLAQVKVDPTQPTNQVASFEGADAGGANLPLLIPDGTTATLFFRAYSEADTTLVDWFAGMSDVEVVDVGNYPDFEAQIGYSGSQILDALRVRDSLAVPAGNVAAGEFLARTWYKIWAVIDNATDTYQVYIQGGKYTNQTQAADASTTNTTFTFRNSAGGPEANDLIRFFVKAGDADHPGPGLLDDIYLAPGKVLTDPSGAGSSPPPAQLRIVEIKPALTTGDITLTWQGDGPQFQVLKATTVTGTFQPLGAVQSARVYTDAGALKASAENFYRIVQISTAPPPALCITTPAINTWVNTPFTNQTGTFTATFDATPSLDAPFDCVMALSSGPKTAFGDFACLVRFNTDGIIDARNGGAYAPVPGVIPYSAGVKYSFRLVVNIPAATYSIYVTPAGGVEQTVGTDFAFRPTAGTITNLNNWGAIVDITAGSTTVCNFKVAP